MARAPDAVDITAILKQLCNTPDTIIFSVEIVCHRHNVAHGPLDSRSLVTEPSFRLPRDQQRDEKIERKTNNAFRKHHLPAVNLPAAMDCGITDLLIIGSGEEEMSKGVELIGVFKIRVLEEKRFISERERLLEDNLNATVLDTDGDMTTFAFSDRRVRRPTSCVFVLHTFILVILVITHLIFVRRQVDLLEDGLGWG